MTDLPFGVAPAVSVLHTTAAQVVDGPSLPEAIVVAMPGRDGDSMRFDGVAATYAALPTTGVGHGDMYLVLADKLGYVWDDGWPPDGDGLEILGVQGDPGLGYATVEIVGNSLRFTRTDATTETVPVPALSVATDAAATATAAAEAASEHAQAVSGNAEQVAQDTLTIAQHKTEVLAAAETVATDRAAAENAASAATGAAAAAAQSKDDTEALTAIAAVAATLATQKAEDAATGGSYSAARRRWARTLAERGTRKIRILHIGDSFTAPIGASWWKESWPSLVAKSIMNDSWSYHLPANADSGVSRSGAVTIYDGVDPGAVEIAASSAVTFQSLDAGLSFDLLWMELDMGGPYYQRPRYQWGSGGTPAEVPAGVAVGTDGWRKYTFESIPGGDLIITPAATAPQRGALLGGVLHRGWGVGIETINLGRSGWQSNQWQALLTDPSSAYWLRERLLAYPADLLHIGLGGNDWVQEIPIETVLQNYRDMIEFYRDTYNPDVSVLLTTMPKPDTEYPDLTDAEWNARFDPYRDLAEEVGTMLSDWRGPFGAVSECPPLYVPGDYHMADPGQRLAADSVLKILHS